ncbi:DUF3846 domain-containing protein [Acutalibacter sp. 1XD8-33]|uniref:DUF3846 domain-containing protein n=1 Tax=Acutalibacter sp. 1XD8-33 TaxID=2320081 RepID=UPI000EA2873C|nr:DUF3846 domain-containing protein [Acutalibacter sp. 1XD8-33]RKJ40120.1 DUF3846 domain-containing protein [Acutalibacter sp. 1XD8-33]
MKTLVVEPGFAPYEKELNSLREMQATVGGTIQAIYPFEEQVDVVCNDDAISLHMPFNRSMEGGYGGVFGTFFMVGLGEEDFISLTPEQVERYKEKFHQAEILLGVDGNELITMRVEPKKKSADPPYRGSKPPER